MTASAFTPAGVIRPGDNISSSVLSVACPPWRVNFGHGEQAVVHLSFGARNRNLTSKISRLQTRKAIERCTV